MRIYLDQNIIGYLHNGSLNITANGEVEWIYSNEHFSEISRGNNKDLLNALKNLRAKEICLQLNENFQITGEAYIDEYSSPLKKYDNFVKTVGETNFDKSIFTDLINRFAGADNYNSINNLPDRIESQVNDLLKKAGIYPEQIENQLSELKPELQKIIDEDLKEVESLESMRKLMGTRNATQKEKYENPIEEIWSNINDQFEGMSKNQFFGFDPIDKQGYKKWPEYLGIVGCHTVLNFLGFRPDKGINKASKIDNILSDGNHIAFAAYCDGVISADKRFCAKARAIYNFRGIPTQVFRYKPQNG